MEDRVTGGHYARFLPSGHLVYATGGTLRAVAFDSSRSEIHGTSVEVAPRLMTSNLGMAAFDVARDGTLVYLEAPSEVANQRTLVWVDRDGRETPLGLPARNYSTPRISPDGTRVAVSDGDLWLMDLVHPDAVATRLTFTPELDWYPVWTPDGGRIVFGSWRGGGFSNLYLQSVDQGTPERLTESPEMQLPTSITPDGASVVFHNFMVNLQRIDLAPPHAIETLIDTPYEERNGEVSPDGRWLAYEGEQANRPGLLDIYVRPFPNTSSGQWQVSVSGGMQPAWSSSGDELFYRGIDGTMMVARVATHAPGFSAEKPVRLFRGPYLTRSGEQARAYDVSPDGKRFLMIKEPSGDPALAPPHLAIVEHLDQDLKRRLP
jgi:serine/threonine-protein kinase